MLNDKNFNFDGEKSTDLYGIPTGFEGFIIDTISKFSNRNLIYIAKDDKDANIIKSSLLFFNSKLNILNFPAWDCMPYDRSGPKLKIQSERLSTLSKLCQFNLKKSVCI